MRHRTRLLCLLILLVAVNTGIALAQSTEYEVVAQYPHDTSAFTQGLELVDGALYESTGLYGSSELRQVNRTTGAVLRRVRLATEYFGEGMTLFRGKIFVLTYESQTALVYDPATFALMGTFSYPGEGWGLTHDDDHLIMSNGTSQIRFLDPTTFQQVRTIAVRDSQGNPVSRLNELEYINGEIFANIWPTNMVARINPATGQLIDLIDFSALRPTDTRVDAFNGIAFDRTTGNLLVTGKWWPTLYEVRLTDGSAPVANSQTVNTLEDTARSISLSGRDEDGDPLTFKVGSPPAHGVLSGTAPSLVYTPSANYNGTDTFTFTVSDGASSSNVATVTVVVAPVNDAPRSRNDGYTTPAQTTLVVAAPGVLSNDVDIDNGALTALLVTGPSRGSLTLSANGSFTYTPSPNFVGTDTFTYKAHDGSSSSSTATASITVSGSAVTVSPSSLIFGAQTVGTTSAVQIVTLTNRASAAITISSITITSGHFRDFVQTNNCGSSVAAYASCRISVAFKPTKGQARTSALAITTSAASTPSLVTLTGTGKKR